MEKRSVAFMTLGCKVNQYETSAMENDFINNGFEIKQFDEKADIYIINTCTVTNVADRKSRQMIRRAKNKNKAALVVACGCYAQVSPDKLRNDIPELDLILGINEKNNIVDIVKSKLDKSLKYSADTIISDVLHHSKYEEFQNNALIEKSRAYIKVQDGCDRFCSYCEIPFARGKVRSRSIKNTISEVKNIAKKGIKEVIVTGIHIASYGKDFCKNVEEFENSNGKYLIELLKEINDVDGIERIRISSIEPKIVTKEFLDELIKIPKICDHFHLSLQSGSEEVLKRMNRRYTAEEFYESVKLLRNYYKNVSITTDVIVGFPGETEQEFNECKEFVKKCNLYFMHVFEYSQRDGTKAAVMPNQINPEIKKKRSDILINLSKEMKEEINNGYLEKEISVLFEEIDKGYLKGHTTNYILVYVKAEDGYDKYINYIVNVKLNKIYEDGIEGEIII